MQGQRQATSKQSKQWGYAATVMLSIAALALTHYLAPMLAPDTAVLLIAAVALSAYVWGLGPGLLAAFFTATGSVIDGPNNDGHGILLTPETSLLAELSGSDFLRLALLMAAAMFISTLRRRQQHFIAPPGTAPADGEQFVVAAAHELRTPLTAIYGQAQLLRRRLRRDTAADARVMHSVDVMVRQADRLNKTVDAFIDVACINQGLLEIERAPLDLDALVRRVVAAAMQKYATSRFTIASPEAALVVAGDETRLTQALHALLDNAVRFSRQGGDVTVALYRDGQQVHVTISDRGIGLPREALPHLFNSFYRAPNGEALCLSGAGIGLYVVRAIVERHGGAVSAANRSGGGSIFRITLPLND